jgi:LacI family transcriptional regulator
MLAFVWHEHQHRWGIAHYAREAHWIFDTALPTQVERVRMWKGHGIICQLHPSFDEFVRSLRRVKLPKVELSDYVPSMKLPRVMPDYAGCGRMVAEHLLARSFRNFAVYRTEHPGVHWHDGFAAPLAAEGLEVTVLRWDPKSARRAGGRPLERRTWLAERLADLPKPVAVAAPSFDLGVEVIDSCERAKLLVPDQVAIVALGDLAPIPLTTISPGYEEQARCAAELLGRMMDGRSVRPETIRIPPRPLAVRQSSDITAVKDIDVARAVTFVRSNLQDKNLWVPEVVQATSMSRRWLERAFREHLGRSIAGEIRRLRLERAMELLATSDMTARAVADACGYRDAKQLRRVLDRATGMTPREYRRRHGRSG